jgi:hypothetical protein
MHNVLNCHNIARHCKFDARNSVRPHLLHGDDHYRYRVSGHAPTFLIPQLDEEDQERRIHFQQDGATPHYLEEVREYLNTGFPGRWIGRAVPIAWPPRFPDFTPLDFFYGDSLNIGCSYHLYLQMPLSSELELLPQLQK